MSSALETQQLLRLLQLASPALPVGAYSYSEGLETLVQQGQLRDAESLLHWIGQELNYGAMRLEATVLVQAYRCAVVSDLAGVRECNQWLSAFREAEELREQSWQMGRSLVRLLLELDPPLTPALNACGDRCHFAIAFAVAAANWQIGDRPAVLGYLQSWATNLVSAGIKLIPLGQTAGQKLLLNLCPTLEQTTEAALTRQNHELESCNWGLAIASMNHETLYSRLFRS